MSNERNLRKRALCMAMGICLASMASAPVLAQSVTGAVAGRAEAGQQVTISNPATGLTRSVTVGSDGNYRIGQLPPGDYTLSTGSGEPIAVGVSIGGTTTVNLTGAGAVDLAAVQVVGSRVINRVDVRSTESATNIRREEIARMPVDQNLASVALLAPGVVSSAASFGGLNFGGSSVAENVVYINGLNVTDPYRRQGFSSVPFGFYEEFQVKTGGYSAEFGRSTGGVINAVTRSGSNDFHAGAEFTMEPNAWASPAKDRFYENGDIVERNRTSRDGASFYKANVWASGALIQDRLFFFGMYEQRDSNPRDIDTVEAWYTDSNNDFWGGKLDWQINDSHLLSLLAFSDKTDSETLNYEYDWDSATRGAAQGGSSSESGGDNWSLTYTGNFTQNFVAKAMYGVNKRRSNSFSEWDPYCSILDRDGTYDTLFGEATAREGCAPSKDGINSRDDKREAARLDFEWTLGDHLLRFGADQEVMDSTTSALYPGDGVRYRLIGMPDDATPDQRTLPNGAVVPVGVNAYVDGRYKVTGAPVSTKAQAIYIEDNWNVTPNLLLNLGVRADKFENTLASGVTFAKADFSDMISPRLGFSWDITGDGTTKLFGNAGRYYIPLTNKLTDYFGGGTIDEHTYYVLDGWEERIDPILGTPYLYPIIGEQLGPVNTEGNAPAPDDVRTAVARDLKQVFQDEFIIGFQQALSQAWSWGVNATYRKMTRAVEDVSIRHVEGCPWYSGDWPILNPGETNTLWCPDTEQWVTFDNSEDGYITSGSGIVMGYKKPRRTYKAVEFQLDRAWDDKWALNVSYLWSKSDGNIEGPVNSDTGYNDTSLVQYYDHPAVNERYGPTFNDYRHQIKIRGSYKFNDMWSVGSTLSVRSGGPITAFGVSWPDDNRTAGGPSEYSGGGSGWLCESGCGDWSTRQLVYTEKGAFGRMPWVTDLGASVMWTLPSDRIDLKARFSIYNLLNQQTKINVHSRYESTPGNMMPHFGEAKAWQSPRYMQLVVTWNFF
jgi:TonB-dependent receptor-like protein